VPDGAKWVDVLVVDKQTERPVADADAVWADDTQWVLINNLPPEERDAAWRDRERIARKCGWHGRSDRDGRLRVNLGKNGMQVFARAGTRYGEVWLRVDNDDKLARRVLLEEDASLSVHVLDAANRPVAGVPLSLETHDAKQTRAMMVGGELTTGADGGATFRHVQSRRTVQWGERRGQPVAQWRVWVGIPGLDLEPVLVDAQAPPAEPVEIRLPPTGRLRAKLTFEGRVVHALEQVAFHVGPKDSSEGHNAACSRRVDADGWARFPCVPLGKTLYLISQGPSQWDSEVAGPTVPDQEVVASFELANEVIALVGRMLRADGTPLGSATVTANFNALNMSGGGQVQTEADGRFVWLLGRGRKDVEPKLRRLAFELREADAPPLRVEVPPRDLEVGRNDLGDLRFGSGALIVGGRFVFDPPPPMRVWLQLQRLSQGQARAGTTERWSNVDGVMPDVRDDGTFEVRGTVEPGRYRINVPAYGFLPVDPVEFALGATDVTIAVRRGAALAVTCLLPPGLDAQRVILRLQHPGASPPPSPKDGDRFGRRDPLRGEPAGSDATQAKYRWPALESGTYELRVELSGFADAQVTVPDVVVPAPAGGDARLLPLDVRDAIGTLRVQVHMPTPGVDERGNRSVYVFPQPQAPDRDWGGVQIGDETVMAVPKRPVDLLIASTGMRPASVRGATGSVDVTLEPWPKVELRVLGTEALPAGAELRAMGLAPGRSARNRMRYALEYSSGGLDNLLEPATGYELVKDGVATLSVGDGAYDLSFYLTLEQRGRGAALKKFTPGQIVAGAPVTVQLDADEVRAAVEKLQQAAPAKK
jgi:hypothetical protein